jgi:hypothetical protein
MLQQTVGSSLPSIFALSASAYPVIHETGHPFTQAASVLSRMQKTYPNVFPHLLHLAAAAGFSNFPEVAQGGRPRGFSIPKYADALRATDGGESLFRLHEGNFSLVDGDYLGPLHYKHAMHQLEEKYERSLTGNEIRRGQAIGLCHFTRRKLPRLTTYDSPKLTGCRPYIDPWLAADDEPLESDLAQRRQNLQGFCHFLSWFAYRCRLDAKVPGELDTFLHKLQTSGIPIQSSLAYLLQIGDALFAYYLIFWELVITAEHIGG